MKTSVSPRTDGRMVPSLAILTLCGAIGLLAGCASEPSSVVVSTPPPPPPASVPVYTAAPVAQPGTAVVAVPAPASGSVVVMQAPPAAQQEVPTARPSMSHVWVSGCWTWRNSQYQWLAGHWEIPPRTGAVWIPPRWEREGSSYRFYEGYWE